MYKDLCYNDYNVKVFFAYADTHYTNFIEEKNDENY